MGAQRGQESALPEGVREGRDARNIIRHHSGKLTKFMKAWDTNYYCMLRELTIVFLCSGKEDLQLRS